MASKSEDLLSEAIDALECENPKVSLALEILRKYKKSDSGRKNPVKDKPAKDDNTRKWSEEK